MADQKNAMRTQVNGAEQRMHIPSSPPWQSNYTKSETPSFAQRYDYANSPSGRYDDSQPSYDYGERLRNGHVDDHHNNSSISWVAPDLGEHKSIYEENKIMKYFQQRLI